MPIYFAAVLVFGITTLLSQQENITGTLTVGGMLQTIFAGLIGLSGPYEYTGRFFPDFFPAALLALGIAGLVIAFAIAFRAVVERAGPSEGDRERARALVRRFGSDTLAPFALRDDKSYFFSSDGSAMIAYTFVSGYALVAADPIGAPASISRVVDEFLAYCRGRAWHVAFLAVREDDMPLYNAHGFRGVYLGDEAIIRCDTFTLDGGALKQVRSAVKRVGKGHHFRLMRESDASPALVAPAQRDPRALAGQGTRARLHDGAGAGRARREPRLPARRRAERGRAPGRPSCASSPATAPTPATRST